MHFLHKQLSTSYYVTDTFKKWGYKMNWISSLLPISLSSMENRYEDRSGQCRMTKAKIQVCTNMEQMLFILTTEMGTS